MVEMTFRGVPAAFVLLLAAASANSAVPVLPDASFYVSAQSTAFSALSTPCDSGLVSNKSGAFASCSGFSAGSTTASSAQSTPGLLRLGADFEATSVGSGSYGADSRATAGLSDFILIAGPANTTALLKGWVVVQGSVSANAGGSPLASSAGGSSYNLTGNFFNQGLGQSGGFTVGSNGYFDAQHAVGESIPISVNVTFDSGGYALGNFSLLLNVSANGLASPYQRTSNSAVIPGSASAAADFAHTIYWGGISSFTVNGNELAAYTVTSSSGFNYLTSAVPEPQTAALMCVGLALLCARARKSRSNSV